MPKIQKLARTTKPPWQLLPPVIDTTLKDVVRGEDDPTWKRTLVEDHIHTYGALKEATLGRDDFHQRRALVEGQIRTHDNVSTAVYTDGSKIKQAIHRAPSTASHFFSWSR